MVHAFVRQSGGTLQLESHEGAGLILPAVHPVLVAQGTLPIDLPAPAS